MFRVGPRLRQGDLADILQTIKVCLAAHMRRLGAADDATDELLAAQSPTLATAQAASIQGRLAFGPRAGQRVTRVGSRPGVPFTRPPRDDCAVDEGFSLHAGPPVPGHDRERLERLCRLCGPPHKRHHVDRGVMRTSHSRGHEER